MERTNVLLIMLLPLLSMAGCFDSGTAPVAQCEARDVTITLEVASGSGSNIPLYRLNDGQRQMEVIAMGFQLPGQEELEVPNPEIRVCEGSTVTLHLVNNSPLAHTIHLHGGLVPWEEDGVPYLTQPPVHTGGEWTYVYEDLKPGTYFYHCHVDVAHHMDLGMYGAFIVEEAFPSIEYDDEFVLLIDEWDNCHVHGNRDPVDNSEQSGEFSSRAGCIERFLQDNFAQNQFGNQATQPGRDAICDIPGLPPEVYEAAQCDAHGARPVQQANRTWWPVTYPVYAPIYNTYLINGKAFPDTEPLPVREGQTVRFRLINAGEEMHSMHLHGHTMLVTHRDGYELESPYRVDTLGIMPGERYDFVVEMDNPGLWAFHDHVALHVMNDDHAPGGMFTCMPYEGFHGAEPSTWDTSLECIDHAMTIFGEHE